MAEQVKTMLANESYNDAITMLNHRERVAKELSLMLNYMELTPAQEQIVDRLKEEIRVLEVENIAKLQKDMEDVKYELDVVSSKVRFRHKYNPYEAGSSTGNVIDTKDNA
jgi:hypothetical protein